MKNITITTFIAADVDDPATRRPVVRTQLALDGDTETVVAEDQADNADLLAMHDTMVVEAVSARLVYLQMQQSA